MRKFSLESIIEATCNRDRETFFLIIEQDGQKKSFRLSSKWFRRFILIMDEISEKKGLSSPTDAFIETQYQLKTGKEKEANELYRKFRLRMVKPVIILAITIAIIIWFSL